MNRRLVAVWVFLCVGLWLLSGFAAYLIGLGVASALPIQAAEAGFEQHRWALSLFVGCWGGLATASVLTMTAALFGLPRGAVRRSLPWMIAGSVIAAGFEFVLLGWGFTKFGVQGADPDLVGPTAFLAMAVVTVATGAVALIAAPRAGSAR